jgi:hypothetical protein|eukprot:CAMPEP_0174357412 /NCGR_PEP_ID=MMETSP0811_2-20130205/35934_1 /TAXON_ID=73025 ORGANISM="Eutreptiella gymnastica-like, Strain CCMP1594" /NCGR_SAMPLE_ID=MMETSP0811_2 /ASSEMBLY_ACC=CAM_ASM_000667 /LENGTH=60 /DNA_ID=CAMNT_0015490217 /DNA_START=274 /DNA_END=456 /DNA_ORIENTATION=+
MNLAGDTDAKSTTNLTPQPQKLTKIEVERAAQKVLCAILLAGEGWETVREACMPEFIWIW